MGRTERRQLPRWLRRRKQLARRSLETYTQEPIKELGRMRPVEPACDGTGYAHPRQWRVVTRDRARFGDGTLWECPKRAGPPHDSPAEGRRRRWTDARGCVTLTLDRAHKARGGRRGHTQSPTAIAPEIQLATTADGADWAGIGPVIRLWSVITRAL